MILLRYLLVTLSLCFVNLSIAQSTLIKAQRLFDGEVLYNDYGLIIEGAQISNIGPIDKLDQADIIIDLGNVTLMPGMIEGHSHILLHPYDETNWNDQVLKESIAERTARATVHVRNSLEAGFTTMRDLGSEGADYADVGIKQSIEKGVIPGPRLIVAGRALVTSGSYGPKGFAAHVRVPLGAEEADGVDKSY